MTTHFAAKTTPAGIARPLCNQRKRVASVAHWTKRAEFVSCSKCREKLGIAASTKRDTLHVDECDDDE